MSQKNRKKHNRTKQLTGVAGEYYVAAELSKRGYVGSITLRNTDGIDILASNSDGSRTVAIQVKTKSDHLKGWTLNAKAENLYNPKLFYIFVNLNNDQTPPDYHIVKSKVVANFVKKGHEKWLRTPGKQGQVHNDTNMRKFRDKECKYKDKWSTLGLE